jgi:Flp pilus assembly protein TadD
MARIASRPLALAVAAAVAAAIAAVLLVRRDAAPPPQPSVLELRLEEWRAAGVLPGAPARDPALAAARIEAGQAALAADLPARTADALRAFQEALALAPERPHAALAGYATAFAEAAGELPDGPDLRAAHELVSEALATAPDRADLLAASARLLLLVPSAANDRDALAAAGRAVAAAPADPAARLALGLAQARVEPATAARTLEEAADAAPTDRRLVTAAAAARWAAGDPAAALLLADRRLEADPDHAAALALRAELLAACDRPDDARATLARWEAAEPRSALPPLLLARLAYQRDGDLVAARRLLDRAMERATDDFVAARVLAHRAAVELAAGDVAAAEGAVADALRRVPASAPARWQAALLAFRRGDAPSLRESAGVLGERGGRGAALLLAARVAELSGTDEDAHVAYRALADVARRDPATLLGIAGALARLRAGGVALEIARRALERDPAEGRLRRAPTDFWEGPLALADAAARLEQIARTESRGGTMAYAAAAACELLLGRTVPAERLARASAAGAPHLSMPLVLLAQVALDRGQARAALAHADDAVDARPDDPLALELRARALEALGRGRDAEQAHRLAAEAAPDLATPRLALARILARRGEGAEARALAAEVLREAPWIAEARGVLLALGTPPAAAP